MQRRTAGTRTSGIDFRPARLTKQQIRLQPVNQHVRLQARLLCRLDKGVEIRLERDAEMHEDDVAGLHGRTVLVLDHPVVDRGIPQHQRPHAAGSGCLKRRAVVGATGRPEQHRTPAEPGIKRVRILADINLLLVVGQVRQEVVVVGVILDIGSGAGRQTVEEGIVGIDEPVDQEESGFDVRRLHERRVERIGNDTVVNGQEGDLLGRRDFADYRNSTVGDGREGVVMRRQRRLASRFRLLRLQGSRRTLLDRRSGGVGRNFGISQLRKIRTADSEDVRPGRHTYGKQCDFGQHPPLMCW